MGGNRIWRESGIIYSHLALQIGLRGCVVRIGRSHIFQLVLHQLYYTRVMNRRLEVFSQVIHARSRVYTKLAALYFIEILESWSVTF